MHTARWEPVIKHTCLLGECPLWDSAARRILWIDILKKQIHQYHLDRHIHKTVDLNQMPGAIALTKSGAIVAALQNGFALVNLKNGKIKMLAETEAEIPENRFNDGKCDPKGRFWAGSMSFSKIIGAGSVYVLEQDLLVSLKISNVTASNGMAWSPDQSTFYYIDTPTQEVIAYNYDVKSGNISTRRVVIHIPIEKGAPDGMTIDSEGMLWIALWGGWKVARWNPNTGEMLNSFSLPASRVTSCTFGGKNLEDLYISTAKTGLSKAELVQQPLAGSLFVVKKSGFKGMNGYKFNF